MSSVKWVEAPHSQKELFVLEKGKPFDGPIPSVDGGQYSFDRSGHWLYLYYDTPTAEELGEFETKTVHFGQGLINGVLFLFAKFGKLNWLEVPYSWWLVPDDYKPELEETDKLHPLVKIALIDRKTGNVVGIRACTFSPEFYTELCRKINLQIAIGWEGKDAYSRTVDKLYKANAMGELVRKYTTHVCNGGD
jgi:hypothetical protein